jgi:hypothetical protein
MAQRGRQSAAALSVVRLAPKRARPRLTAPSSLTKAEQSIFDAIASDNDHLTPTDSAMLAAYAQAALKTFKLAREKGAVQDWERAARVMAMLGTKLRITAQAAVDPKTLGRRRADCGGFGVSWQQMQAGDGPWVGQRDDDDDIEDIADA